ncbi:hypothetical protein [Bradyrhizobium prioriisuperbiae]|uniref:hypothetical protein n=1 Tax=Bradyrhizobium prioriisuperbiae TaxID=2854389 RepID=UPI0028EAB75B|nr:hypothetical protein [Bradyrhizobium prioritasuperba]
MVRHTDADEKVNTPLMYGDQHVDKPKKAALGLGLLLAIALALYGFNTAHSAGDATRTPSAALQNAPLPGWFDSAHLAPREDTSLR